MSAGKVVGGIMRRVTGLGGGRANPSNPPREREREASSSSEAAPLLDEGGASSPVSRNVSEETINKGDSVTSDSYDNFGTPMSPTTSRMLKEAEARASSSGAGIGSAIPPNNSAAATKRGHARSISQHVDPETLDLVQNHTPDHSQSENLSEDNDEPFSDEDAEQLPQKEGDVSKWTNYIHGWQDRYLVLSKGTLSYFKSREENKFCRANINIVEAEATKHEFDPLRFDIRFGDQAFYIRTKDNDEREEWLNAIWDTQDSAEGAGLRRCGSLTSLVSTGSMASNGPRSIQDKVLEIRAFHQRAANQLEALLDIVDADTTNALTENSDNATLKREMLNFKTTATGVLTSLEDFMELVKRREETWKRRMQKLTEKKDKYEALYKAASAVSAEQQMLHGPDMQEGPNSLLTEEQWFDALEEQLDEEEPAPTPRKLTTENSKLGEFVPAWRETIEREIKYVEDQMDQGDQSWEVINQDGDIKVSRLQVELSNGNVVESCRTEADFPGLTAREIADFFIDQKYRRDWETVLEKIQVIETPEDHTNVVYSKYKRVWPSAQRDLVNICHRRQLSDGGWVSITASVDHPDYPANANNLVRLDAKARILARTEFKDGYNPKKPSRRKILSKIYYFAEINPGGWAPKSIVKAVSVKEFPKALRALRTVATEHFRKEPVLL